MNLMPFLIYYFIYGLKYKGVKLSGFRPSDNVKVKIVGSNFILSFNVKIFFIEIEFKQDLFPANLAVCFRIAGGFITAFFYNWLF